MTAGAPKRRLPWAYRLVALLLRPLLMWVTKRDWRGLENIPAEGGFVVSTNHISYADPLRLRALHVRQRARAPTSSARTASSRSRSSAGCSRSAARSPSTATPPQRPTPTGPRSRACAPARRSAIFPEGTITRDPDLWPMRGKTGAARVALETRCPLIPVAQWGAQEILSPYGHKPSLFPRKTMMMYAGPPVDLSDLYDRPIDTKVLREATDRLMDRITELLEVLPGREASDRALRPAPARRPRDRRPPGAPRDRARQASPRPRTGARRDGSRRRHGQWQLGHGVRRDPRRRRVRRDDVGASTGGRRRDQRRAQRGATCPSSSCRRPSAPPSTRPRPSTAPTSSCSPCRRRRCATT